MRVRDVLSSAIGLLLLAPLFLVIAVAIRMDSPGPVFFRQTRVGLHGRHFRIHKFRSMRVCEAGLSVSTAVDPRITRVGRLLRRAKLDELPQLIDVLRGTMSLVGPRPEVPQYVDLCRVNCVPASSPSGQASLILNPPTLFCEAFAKCVRGGGLG